MAARLLSTAQLAEKLGFIKAGGSVNVELFYRNRNRLEAAGLPLPTIGRGRGQKWDAHAIDLWLDGRIPSDLRRRAATADQTDWHTELARRATDLSEAT